MLGFIKTFLQSRFISQYHSFLQNYFSFIISIILKFYQSLSVFYMKRFMWNHSCFSVIFIICPKCCTCLLSLLSIFGRIAIGSKSTIKRWLNKDKKVQEQLWPIPTFLHLSVSCISIWFLWPWVFVILPLVWMRKFLHFPCQWMDP